MQGSTVEDLRYILPTARDVEYNGRFSPTLLCGLLLTVNASILISSQECDVCHGPLENSAEHV